ncbi:MAG: hypothetical protein IMF01_09545 [Proteobacteria bacterium]|nr:hypothetical protein [Pseudomonadota bacterium]
MSEYIGLWWLIVYKSELRIIEIGFGDTYTEGNYGAFSSTVRKCLGFYWCSSRATMSYINKNRASYERGM